MLLPSHCVRPCQSLETQKKKNLCIGILVLDSPSREMQWPSAFSRPPVTVASLQTQLLSSSLPPLPLKKEKQTKTTLLEELMIGKG